MSLTKHDKEIVCDLINCGLLHKRLEHSGMTSKQYESGLLIALLYNDKLWTKLGLELNKFGYFDVIQKKEVKHGRKTKRNSSR